MATVGLVQKCRQQEGKAIVEEPVQKPGVRNQHRICYDLGKHKSFTSLKSYLVLSNFLAPEYYKHILRQPDG